MRRMRTLVICGVAAVLTVAVFAQEPVDTAMVAKIRAEGLDRAKVLDT